MNPAIELSNGGIYRMRVQIRGAVQGVGFRPFVFRQATERGLTGRVSNGRQGVIIEVEGEKHTLDDFLISLDTAKPPHAFIQSVETSYLDPVGYSAFEIVESSHDDEVAALVQPDIATCPACLEEIFAPANRRYLYPFTNCTHCGPRYTIIEALPYDRENTSMKKFMMCDDCRLEYGNPLDRRFHAQPNACPRCGPHVELWTDAGSVIASHIDAMKLCVDFLDDGKIVAVKGIGGFHVMVDAQNEAAVTRLRERKHREAKPLAVMFPSLAAITQDCEVSELEKRLLTSSEAPIVLLTRREGSSIARATAPNNPKLGAMLPYAPLHHILLSLCKRALVATSGNLSDEPICIDEHEALGRLRGIADAYLVHNRPILRHVDDSVCRVILGREQVLRRARGYAPLPVGMITHECSALAVGAHQKNTVALTSANNVFISQHIGDLETMEAYRAFKRVTSDLKSLLETQPTSVVSDLHPNYISTHFAGQTSLPVTQIQHHYAHVASCMAENQLSAPVLGVAWDGTGYGTDGTIWGGEFLLATEQSFVRSATFRTFRLPGNDAAVKEPRRIALGLLYEVLGDAVFDMKDLNPVAAFDEKELTIIRQMIVRRVNSPLTSSVGRLFDAVASVIDLRQRVSFEGQAAMELEYAIAPKTNERFYEYHIETDIESKERLLVVDWVPMIANILHDVFNSVPISTISQHFHNTLVEIIVDVARQVGTERVALSGGCFQNAYLTERGVLRLTQEGFKPYWHQRVPPNDGGISYGQIAAFARMNPPKNQEKGAGYVLSNSR